MAIRVVIADDHPIIVDGVAAALDRHADLELVGTFPRFDGIAALLKERVVDVLVLDLTGMDGSPIATIQSIRQQQPRLSIIVFSSTITMARSFLDFGVRGYVAKSDPLDCLVAAIQLVRHRIYLSPTVETYLDQIAQRSQSFNLTPREIQLLQLMSQGLSTVQIAEELDIRQHTVHNYINGLRNKTGCLERIELINWYRRIFGGNDL